jgi:hypothetical protein
MSDGFVIAAAPLMTLGQLIGCRYLILAGENTEFKKITIGFALEIAGHCVEAFERDPTEDLPQGGEVG